MPAATAEAPTDTFTWVPRHVTLPANDVRHIAVDLLMPQGYEVFRNDVHITIVEDAGLEIGAPEFPAGRLVEPAHGGRDETPAVAYVNDLRVLLPVAPGKADPGLHVVRLQAEVRGCSAKRCHEGAKAELTSYVQIVPRDVKASPK